MKKFLCYSFIVMAISGTLFVPAFGLLSQAHAQYDSASDYGLYPNPDDISTGFANVSPTPEGNAAAAAATANANVAPATGGGTGDSTDDACGLFHIPACVAELVPGVLKWIGNLVLEIVSIFLFIAGNILDLTLQYTLINMTTTLQNVTALYSTWQVVRDTVNIFFIFVLLYTAIGTMFGLEQVNWKKKVIQLILVAIFINFTLFMTQALTDFSNVAAFGFYQAIPGIAGVQSPCDGGSNESLSGSLMGCLKLSTIYSNQTVTGASTLTASTSAFTSINLLITTILGIIVILITSFIFILAAILFGIRFVILIFLMITSPVAFIGYLLPKMKTYADKWWGALTNQLIFAPMFMMMLWISMRVIGGVQGAIIQSVGGAGANQLGFGDIAAASVTYAQNGSNTLSGFSGIFSIFFNFAIVIAFLILTIYVAKESGAVGFDFAKKVAGKATFGAAGWLGRNTAGRLASKLEKDEGFQRFGARNRFTQSLYDATKGVARSSFDVRGINKGMENALGEAAGKEGFQGQLTADIKSKAERLKNYSSEQKNGVAGSSAREIYQKNLESGPLGLYGKTTLGGLLGRGNRTVVAQHEIDKLKKKLKGDGETGLQRDYNKANSEFNAKTNQLNGLLSRPANTLTPQDNQKIIDLRAELAQTVNVDVNGTPTPMTQEERKNHYDAEIDKIEKEIKAKEKIVSKNEPVKSGEGDKK